MDLTRRGAIGAICGVGILGTVGGAGGAVWLLGGNDTDTTPQSPETTETPEEVPPEVERVKPLAIAFYKRINKYFDAKVWATSEGEVAVEYQTKAESEVEIDSEFAQIADLYARTIKEGDYDPATLSIIVGKVQGIVPLPSLKAYLDGRINKEAYLKTIEVTDIERRGD